jgi:Ca2+-binding RTX toxin-like protein
VLFGDTTEDGSRYSSDTATVEPGVANGFSNSGNDTIEASALVESVVAYGGAGNDSLVGSQAADQLAGGSGNDTLSGQDGDDHLYGDSGFNLDNATRDLMVVTQPTTTAASVDDLVAGSDSLDGGNGADIILGDHGVIEQTTGTQRILNTGNVERVYTAQPTKGVADTISGGTGFNQILGGLGADTITSGDDGSIVFGDFGTIDYVSIDNDLTDIDLIQSDPATTALGDNDAIATGLGNDIILGGMADDTITTTGGHNIVFGDSGTIDYTIDSLLNTVS